MSLGVEGYGADGCHDNHHTQRHRCEQHDNVLGSIHERLLGAFFFLLVDSIARRLLRLGTICVTSPCVVHRPAM